MSDVFNSAELLERHHGVADAPNDRATLCPGSSSRTRSPRRSATGSSRPSATELRARPVRPCCRCGTRRRTLIHAGFDYSYWNLSQNTTREGAAGRAGCSSFQVVNPRDSGTIFSRRPADRQRRTRERDGAVDDGGGRHGTVTNAYTGGLPAPTDAADGVTRVGRTSPAAGVECLRFLTDDTRPYVKERPGYGRVSPAAVQAAGRARRVLGGPR